MTHPIPTPQAQRAAWTLIEARLAALDWEPPLTTDRLERLLARLPARGTEEPLTDWLARAYRPAAAEPGGARVVPLRPRARLRLIGQAVLPWAAADAEVPLPTQPHPLVIDPGGIRIDFRIADGTIHIRLQALGFTLARLRGREVALTGPAGETEPLARLTLGPGGEGDCAVPDTPEHRRRLQHLHLWQIAPP